MVAGIWITGCAAIQSRGIGNAPTSTPANDFQIHTVKEGESLSQIAIKYRVTVEQLIAVNLDAYPALARDPSLIEPGWELRVPAASGANRAGATVQPRADLAAAAQQIIEGINTARAQRGIALLRAHSTLARIAGDRSRDMIARNYFSHSDPATGQEPLLRYLQATKFSYNLAGENIAEIKNESTWVPAPWTVAARYDTAELADRFVQDWLKSPEHRENIFQPRYRRTGVGLAVSEDGKRIMVSQVFAD